MQPPLPAMTHAPWRVLPGAHLRAPGTLERTWNRMPAGGMGGMGMGGFMAGNFMSTIAGVMVGSMIADAGGAIEDGVGDFAGDLDGGFGDIGGLGDFGDFGGDF